MKKINNLLVSPDTTILDTLKMIDKNGKGIAFVVDNNKYLMGTITDGDLRRAALGEEEYALKDSIKDIYNKNCLYVYQSYSLEDVKKIFSEKAVKCVPVVNEDYEVVSYVDINDLFYHKEQEKENPVLIMAGGLGTRLKPLTDEVPKPMLHVGGKPILEILIDQFKNKGYKNILISINYKSHIIENYFRNGEDFGVKIKYITENQRMGTAGPIKLAEKYLNKPFFVINGDILTNVNFEKIMQYHLENDFALTIASRNYEMQIPYGVIDLSGKYITEIREKPVLDFLVSGGIYALSPRAMQYIPEGQYFDITELTSVLIQNEEHIGSFPIEEYWMDIGQMDDYHKANLDVHKYFI